MGSNLAAIAGLEPAYAPVRRMWSECNAVYESSAVFNKFESAIYVQKSQFAFSVNKYYHHINVDTPESRWVDEVLQRRIRTQVKDIVTIFKGCCNIAKNYLPQGEYRRQCVALTPPLFCTFHNRFAFCATGRPGPSSIGHRTSDTHIIDTHLHSRSCNF